MTNEQEYKIETYLSGEMPPDERQAFEAELAADAELRRELRLHQLADKAIELKGQARLREMMQETRAKLGPLPEPESSFFDRPRQLLRSWMSRGIAAAVALALIISGGRVAVVATLCPDPDIHLAYYIEPPLYAHAGSEDEDKPKHPLHQSREYYQHNNAESLQQLAQQADSRNVANYYLAHWHLKQGDFQQAEEAFAEALAQREQLQQYSDLQDIGALKFNLLLSEFGQSKDRQATLANLAALKADPDFKDAEVQAKAAKLEKDLKNPLFRMVCLKK